MSQLIMLILISLLILVHEMGHFIAARIFGVRVERFGIGMPIGPSWKLFTLGKTDFYLHSFLFGGYVAFIDDDMLSDKKEKNEENNEDDKKKEEKEEKEIIPEDSPERYENKTILQKLIIVSAGVIMNVVFAVILVIFCAIFFHKLPTSSQNIIVNGFSSKVTSDIQQFDIKKGDKISEINGNKINTFYQLTFYVKNSKLFDNYAEESLIKQNTEELKKINPSIDFNSEIKEGTVVSLPSLKEEPALNVNNNILKGLEKYKKSGTELTKNQIELRNKIYGKKSYKVENPITLNDLAYSLSDTYKPLDITFLRNNQEIKANNVKVGKEGLLGITLNLEDVYTQTETPKQIIVKSVDYIYTTTTTMLYALWQLVCGKVSASDMHGVIAVIKVGGDVIASKGMLDGILLTAMISINLAIMNFLPIPALDGGHVMFLIIEKLTGKKPEKELAEKINNFFFVLLIILMVAICYNDIFALITKKF